MAEEVELKNKVIKVMLKSGEELIHIGNIKMQGATGFAATLMVGDMFHFEQGNPDLNESDASMIAVNLIDYCEYVYLYNVFNQEEGHYKYEFYYISFPYSDSKWYLQDQIIVGEKIESNDLTVALKTYNKKVLDYLAR